MIRQPIYFFIVILILLNQNLFSQNFSKDVIINWKNSEKNNVNGQDVLVPNFDNIDFSDKKPIFFINEKSSGNSITSFQINNLVFIDVNVDELNYLKKFNINIPDSIEYSHGVSKSINNYRLIASLFPYTKINGEIKKISSFSINISYENVIYNLKKKDFVTESVLSNSNDQWYKISISEDGIYRINKSFLENIGINTSELNPKKINIYGNGTGRLPEDNSIPRPDDLVKNAIFIQGENDNSFDDNDYILFYGWGPNKWEYKDKEFQRDMNPHSLYSYYFIRISENDIPERIQTAQNNLTSNNVVNSYNYYAIYEKESLNIFKAGQRWYGEIFDVQLSHNFSFNIPNIVQQDTAKFKIYFAGKNISQVYANLKATVNSNQILNFDFGSSSYDYSYYSQKANLLSPTQSLNLNLTLTRNNPQLIAYLDKIELNTRRQLSIHLGQINFRDLNSIAPNNISEFTISNANVNTFVWNITHRQKPKLVQGIFLNNQFTFIHPTDSLYEFVASNGTNYFTPKFVEKVTFQNLHGLDYADYLIVTPKRFISHANRLANLHRDLGTSVHVVPVEEIYNEFSSGAVDPTAIRWFVKMFYDRANGDINLIPKSLLLFGGGTYDNRGLTTDQNFLPTYETKFSEDKIASLVSDDYFAMLDDHEDFRNQSGLDIGVGRLLISSEQIANEQIQKIETYIKNGFNLTTNNSSDSNCCGNETSEQNFGNFGDWKLNYVQIADDQDGGQFITDDAEPQCAIVENLYQPMLSDKLYTDAFPQITTAGGQRYPSVVEAINNNISNGALLFNFIGHGGISGAMDERVITIPQIESWSNSSKLNLFITGSCELTRYDDHDVFSAGEKIILNPNGGSVALITTTRSIYVHVNRFVVQRLFNNLFLRDSNNKPLSFGEVMRRSMNETVSFGENRRCFTLIGDPQLGLALPLLNVVTDSINGKSPNIITDTILGLSKMTIKGHVEDHLNNIQTDFNGFLTITIFDKEKDTKTLGQDATSPILTFKTQKNKIFKGKATVKNGYFETTFIIPKDIDFNFGAGRIQYYIYNQETDGAGVDKRIIVGGLNTNGLSDKVGPTIEMYLNDQSFISGGITDENPKLIVNVFDESGINTVGNGIGHDIIAILDDKTAEPIILNNFYESDIDTYQSGKVRYSFTNLTPGQHNLKFKIWDVNNNPSELKLDFVVQEKKEIALSHVLNYPNPFTTRTEFYFEHNQVCNSLEAQIEIFTVAGRLVKTINKIVRTQGFRSEGIEWNGLDEYGDVLAKGVYIYRISVKTPDGEKAQKLEKLVLLR